MNLVRGFATTADKCRQDLQGQTPEQLFQSVSSFTPRRPALVFGIAALAGFIGFRAFKTTQFPLVRRGAHTYDAERDQEIQSGGLWLGQPARAFSAVSTLENAISDETPDGLNATEESLRRAAEAAGSTFMNEEEVNAHIEWLREGDRIDDLLRQVDDEHQPRVPS